MISGEFITYSLPSNQTLKLHHKRELGFQLGSHHSRATERSKRKVGTKGQEVEVVSSEQLHGKETILISDILKGFK